MSETELKQMSPVSELQWSRLSSELGVDALREFAIEFFNDLQTQWGVPVSQLHDLPEKKLRSLAHRYAGTAGTLGFPQIRQCLLNIQYADNLDHLSALISTMFEIVETTKSVVVP